MIQISSIHVVAGSFELQNLSFTIPAGSYAVLMGRTGIGKTTILECLCGLRRVRSGTIALDGIDVTDWMPADRQVGYVPQDLALFPRMTVREHLAFSLRLRKLPAKKIATRVAELADQLGLEELLQRKPHSLSGGQSQRVALGRALSFAPTILLLDEPLSALDEATRFEMQDLLLSIKQRTGVTVLHVTHNQSEADGLADHRLQLTETGEVNVREIIADEA